VNDVIVPEGWTYNEGGLNAKVKGGYAFKSSGFKKEGILLIKISNISNYKTSNSDRDVYLPAEYLSKFVNFKLNENDFLIAMSGATTGKIGLVKKEHSPSLLNQRVGKFEIINPDKLDNKFLFYSFDSTKIMKKILDNAASSAQPNVSPSFLESIKILLPPLPEQQKIADILSKVDEQIAQTEAIIDHTQRVKQGLLQQLFIRGIGHTRFKRTEIGEIPVSWDVVQLGEVFSHRKEPGISDLPVISVTMKNGLVERHTLDRRVVSSILVNRMISVIDFHNTKI